MKSVHTGTHYENPKKAAESSVQVNQDRRHQNKISMEVRLCCACIWWDQEGIVYFELLKQLGTVSGERYRRRPIRLKVALGVRPLERVNGHDKIILQYDNPRPPVVIIVEKEQQFTSYENLKKWVDSWIATRLLSSENPLINRKTGNIYL